MFDNAIDEKDIFVKDYTMFEDLDDSQVMMTHQVRILINIMFWQLIHFSLLLIRMWRVGGRKTFFLLFVILDTLVGNYLLIQLLMLILLHPLLFSDSVCLSCLIIH